MENTNNQKGFSLIEVMIAMTIFAIGLLAVITMQLTAIRGNSSSRDVTEAALIAQQKIEEFYLLPYDDPALDTTSIHGPIASGNYTYSWTVVEGGVIANTKTITLSVQYQRRGQTKSVQVVTVKSGLI